MEWRLRKKADSERSTESMHSEEGKHSASKLDVPVVPLLFWVIVVLVLVYFAVELAI
jgi:hypothetical protein